jgi:dihydrofolate reductase
VSISSERPSDLYGRLAAQGARHLYIDGGLTIQAFLQAGLIDNLTITIIPILLGSGKPLFGPLKGDVQLEHLATKAYGFGFVQSQYRVIKSEITPAPSPVRL